MKITVIIPVYQPDERFLRLLQSLAEQTVQFRVMVIDSGNSEAFYQAYLRPLGAVVQHIEARMFDHGATRQMGIVMNPDADVYVFLTQDAILAAQDAISRLAGAFANPKIGCAYGRQLPHKNAGIFAAGARAFNYPSESYIRSYGDKERYGIRTAFMSNSFAGYRREAVYQAGGFPQKTIFGEDMYLAGRMLKSGWQVAYVAEAQVYHSHEYTLPQEFKRYFDMGVFHARESWLRKEFGRAEGEGKKFVLSQLKTAARYNLLLCGAAVAHNAVKLAGYKLGGWEKYLPQKWKLQLTMNKNYWNR